MSGIFAKVSAWITGPRLPDIGPSPQAAKEGWRERLARSDAYEAEGAAAALAGRSRDSCPYTDRTSTAWNFWIWGFDQAKGELETIKAGEIFYCTTGTHFLPDFKPGTGTPLKDAIAWHGWRPRFAKEAAREYMKKHADDA